MEFLPAQINLRFLKTCEHDAAMEDPVCSRSGRSSSEEKTSSHFQLADCAPHSFQVDLEWLCRVNSNSKTTTVKMDQDAYIPVSDTSSEANDFLAAVVEATTLCPGALDAGSMDLDVPTSLAGMHDPDRVLLSMAPPKRFYRRHWQSVSQRLLHRWTTKSEAPTRKVA